MKKFFKKSVAYILTIALIGTMFSTAVFAAIKIINTTEITRIDTIQSYDNCGSTGGLITSTANNRMYAVKSNSTDTLTKFFYYPDITNTSNRRVLNLKNAGHANGMAIDGANVYVLGWIHSDDTPKPYSNNRILQIPRAYIHSLSDGAEIQPQKAGNPDNTGYKILQPKMVNPNASEREKTPYVNYTEPIAAISKYKTNGTFIIDWNTKNEHYKDFRFATAKLVEYNGETLFVVSIDPKDTFVIKNNLTVDIPGKQDICYFSGKGFFVPIWYGKEGYNKNKNVILWTDIDNADYSYIEINGSNIRYYTPDKISVNLMNVKGLGVTMYEKFEFESLAFTALGEMYISSNVVYTEAYDNLYKNHYGTKPPVDVIFKLTYDGGKNFTL